MELADKGVESPVGGTPSSLEKERIMNEDPKWNGEYSFHFHLFSVKNFHVCIAIFVSF